ncbi:MAG: LacI family DNA-binding transcriptional regulator [Phycisphaerae bacterium]|nr:LacI family DNA-binding transcriptional regulator [Phycisphaerae bacterium]
MGTASSILGRRAENFAEKTRQAVWKAAKELNYQPNATARALATSRTGHIGFILSDSIAGGWLNAHFARYLAGVEHACRRRGYGLNVSLYNLSNLDTFVFPARVGQRSVDGVILTGQVETEVIEQFREFKIPTISLGQDVEIANLIPSISCDDVSGEVEAIRHAVRLGHRNILKLYPPSRRGIDVSRQVIEQIQKDPETTRCRIELIEPAFGHCDYSAGQPLLEHWLAQPTERRATLVMGSDQTMTTFLKSLQQHGMSCPADVSVISNCESLLCEMSRPSVTSVDYNMEDMGELAVDLLIDHLDLDKPLTPDMSRNDYPCRLIVRDSCDRPGMQSYHG